MKKLKVLAVSGSLRTASINRRALQIAKKIAAELGVEVFEIDLRELNLPIDLLPNTISTATLKF